MLRVNVFTQGKKLGKVKQFDFQNGGEKWGSLSIKTAEDLKNAKPWLKESLGRIKKAIKNNESTGWYAQVETQDEE